MKNNCEEVSYTLSNNKQSKGYRFEEKIILICKPVNDKEEEEDAEEEDGEEIKLRTMGISGAPGYSPTLGHLGLENMKLSFDDDLEKLVKRKKIIIGTNKKKTDIMVLIDNSNL